MAELGYQNPLTSTDARLESTQVNPADNQTGVEVRRENVQVFTSSEARQIQEMVSILLADEALFLQMRRHSERFTATDSRGGSGRGSRR